MNSLGKAEEIIEEQKIRDVVINELLEALDRSIFTRHGFAIEHSPSDQIDLRIFLRDYPEYRVDLRFPQEGYSSQPWKVSMQPGEVTVLESRQVNSTYELGEALQSWAARIEEELRERPTTAEELLSLRAALDQAIENLDDPDTPFGVDEARGWEENLDTIYNELEGMQDRLDVTEQELVALKVQLEQLRSNTTSFPKKVWVRSAGNILYAFLKRVSPTVVAAVTEGAVAALMPPPR